MDISADKYNPEGDKSGSLPVLMKTIGNIIQWLTGFFALTEEERSKAGIFLGGEGRE
jgi:hypothetical protein